MKSIHPVLSNGRLKEFLLVTGIALLLASLLLFRTDLMTYAHPDFAKPWDHLEYIQMATEKPFDFSVAPYCWRIGAPMLAKALPFDRQSNFLIISFLSIWLTGVAIYYLGKRFKFTKTFAFVGLLMFYSLGWATKFLFYDFWLPDPLSFLLITLVIYFILVKNDLFFAVLLALGVAVKESVFFTAPLYYTLNAHKLIDLKIVKRTIFLAIPAIVILIALRILIPATGDDLAHKSILTNSFQITQTENSNYNFLYLFKKIGLQRISKFSFIKLFNTTIGAFGVMLFFIPFLALRRNINTFLKFSPFLFLIYSQLLFATNAERLLVTGFPAMIILTLNGAEAITQKIGIKPAYFLILPLLLFGANLINAKTFSPSLALQSVILVLFLALLFQLRRLKI